jgi:endonuclease G
MAFAASPNVVISQVYGGGGSSSGTPAYTHDYVELHNMTAADVEIGGWSLQYGSSSGNFASTTSNLYVFAAGTKIAGGKYLTVKLGTAGTAGATFTADLTSGGLSMAAGSGKVALARINSGLTCGATATPCAATDPRIVDLVSYGASNNAEGTPVNNGVGLTSAQGAIRKNNGCTDTDNNNADFTVATVASGLVPRTSGADANTCGSNPPPPPPTNDAPAITAFANPVTTVEQDSAAFSVSLSGSDDKEIYNWSATAGAGVSAVAVSAGQGSANVTYSVTLQAGFSGTASFTAALSDNVNTPVTRNVTITVNAAAPPPLDHVVISQVYGGGGNSGAAFQNDFVELYNASTVSHDLSGWTIQYGSATGSTWQVQPLGGTIAPGEYYLIRLATNGTSGSVLPSANINGELNLSGTNGKVALSRTGDPLTGCTLSDPNLVDLVGYGTTANCREGASNAPTPSNATAVIRKNGGFTDTNFNGADFFTGTPNPRRTTPIVELPPTVLNSDPRSNGSNAPRDANITVSFTEAVEVESGWFAINCANSGAHNSATVAQGGPNAWIIIPNVNFQAGEQCTVTIYKDFVRDADLDDAGANTDFLTHNYSATFTVATGAAPSYPADVHMLFGNPNGATADVENPNNYLMVKPEFALSYNRDRGTPNWVSWHLADEWIGSLARFDTFRADPAVPAEWYRVTHTDYLSSGFDRGHMVPNADRDPETSTPINQATFLMTNMIPQAPDNNQGPWANMEGYLRTLLPGNELYIVAGGAGTGGNNGSGIINTIANGRVSVPAFTWKVALVLPKQSGDDVSRVTAATRTIAVIMPNVQGIRNIDWMSYLTSIDQVEALTGYDLFANVPDAIENAIEAGVNGVNPPGVEDQSFSVSEDVEKTFTIAAANGSDNTLTYTIVAQPSHGTLSGDGANQTYTPAPDFNGSDSFTFRVSDGSRQSNVGTMTITVLEVNDAPTANTDARNTDEDAALQFSASELSANDVAGPADEQSQTLTVTSVAATADTHGTVSLANGTIVYTPAVNYNGAASFTYEVCDNGVTRGLTTRQCATSTVTIDVAAVNDAPAISTTTGPTTSMFVGSAATVSVTATDLDVADTHTATFAWGDGTTSTVDCTSGNCSTSHAYTAAGIYTVSIVVADAAGATATSSISNVIVTDANAGFLTGGGWINTASGKASLNVNAKYQKNAAPIGNTNFDVAGVKFKSTAYEWLVVSGANATYQGTGTVNGAGNYGFLITVADASTDTFSIRVWDKSTGATLYETAGALGGGNISIHR